jgi:energy-coupling factor transporter ATP-binding protein EcfA2
MISLKTFLTVLFRYCDEKQIECLFARRYPTAIFKEFQKNISIFAQQSHLPTIIKMLTVWPDIQLTGVIPHPGFTRLYIHGVKQGQCRFLALDIHHEATFEGTAYLHLNEIMLRKVPSETGLGFEPSIIDLGLIALFDDILKPRFVPEQARQDIIRAIKSERQEFFDTLVLYMGADAPVHVGNVIDIYDTHAMRKLAGAFRRFAYRTQGIGVYLDRLADGVRRFYHMCCSRGDLRIAIIGSTGSGKSTIVSGLTPFMRNSRDQVTRYVMLPKLWDKISDGLPRHAHDHSHTRNPVLSCVVLTYQIALCWLDTLKPRRYSRTLLFDGHISTIMINPDDFRYGGPDGFARFMTRLLPRTHLYVWVATPPSVAHQRRSDINLGLLTREYAFYKEFAEQQTAHVVYTASADIAEFLQMSCEQIQNQIVSRTTS